MPYGDGTGPMGYGPMTGRAAGYCAGYSVPGYMNPIAGRGWGFWGRGRGRGFQRWAWTPWAYPPYAGAYAPYAGYPYPPTPEQELELLKGQAENLKATLDDVNARIEELSKEKK
jgi:hypothetical protein